MNDGPRTIVPASRPASMTDLEDPRPRPSKRSYASFLEDSSETGTSLNMRVSSWLESIEPGEDRLTWSESELPCSPNPIQSRPRSAPEIRQPDNGNGSIMQPAPTPSTTSASRRRTQTSSLGPRDKDYRVDNLVKNGIFIIPDPEVLPANIEIHVAEIRDKSRDSPGLSPEELAQYRSERRAVESGYGETTVTQLVKDWVLPSTRHPSYRGSGLQCHEGISMSTHLIPAHPAASATERISVPKPDFLYGYAGSSVPLPGSACPAPSFDALAASPFSQPQLLAQEKLAKYPGQKFARANSERLLFPFFVVELKADAGTGGSIWVAGNQGAGGSAACLNAAERLNDLLQETNQPMIDNLTYCVAMDQRNAQLYVSWKPGRLTYYRYEVRSYMLSRNEGFKDFRRHVRNILDWGKDKRLQQIRDALDAILEEDCKRIAEGAKNRSAPSVVASGSDGPVPKRRRPSGSLGRGQVGSG